MSCPYLQTTNDDLNQTNNPDIEGNIQSPAEMFVSNDSHKSTTKENDQKEPLNYTKYICTEQLLTALKCLSHIDPLDENSPHVHDEHFFILIHQGNDSKSFKINQYLSVLFFLSFRIMVQRNFIRDRLNKKHFP